MIIPKTMINREYKFFLLGDHVITGRIIKIDNKSQILKVLDKFNIEQLIPIEKIIRFEIVGGDANDP